MFSKIKQKDFPNSLARFLLQSLLVVIPLLFLLNFATIFTAPKLLYLRGISVLISLIFIYQFSFQKNFTLKVPIFAKNFLPWFFSLLLSTTFTVNIYSSLYGQFGRYMGLITLLNFLLLPFFFWQYFEKKDLRDLLLISLSTAVLAALYGIFQYFNFFGIFSWGVNWSDSPQTRIFGTVGHANHLGAYLAANLLILLFVEIPVFRFLKTKPIQKYFRLFWKFILGLVLIFALVLTASRGALLAFLLAALIFSLIYLHFKKHDKSKTKTSALHPGGNKKSLAAKIIIALIILVIIFISAFSYFEDKIPGLEIFVRSEATFSSIQKGYIPERLSFALSSLEMFVHDPILGTGLSTFRDSYNLFRRSDYMVDGPGNLQYITVPEAAHNEFLNILSTQGLLGLLAYLWLIVAAFRLIFINLKNAADPSEQKIILAVAGAFSVYLIQTLFNFGEIVNLTIFYFTFAAIGFYSPQKKYKILSKNLPFQTIFSIVVVILLLGFSYFQIYNVAVAEISLKSAQDNQQNSNIESVEKSYISAIQAMPFEYSLYQNLGDFSLLKSSQVHDSNQQQAFLEKAVNDYISALQLNDFYSSTYNNLALAYFSLYDLTKVPQYKDLGKSALYNAVQKGPNNPRYIYEYARKLDVYFQDETDAIKYLKQALQINPNYQEPQDYLNFIYKNHPEILAVPQT